MAAGIVYHDITTASGVTFSLACWVPNTAAPDVGCVPVSLPVKSDGTVADPSLFAQGGGSTLDDIVTALGDGSAHVIIDSAVGVAQGSTTSGQTISIVGAAVLKTAPSYTSGQTSPPVVDPAGNLLTLGGGMGVISKSHTILASDGAQTDYALLSVSSGTKIIITQISAKVGANVTANCAVRIGFAAATLSAEALAGNAGMLLEGVFSAGGGQQVGNGAAVVAVGASDGDLRLTCDAPTGGKLFVTYTYYTIAS